MTTNPRTVHAPEQATLVPLFQLWLQADPGPRCISLLARGEPFDICDALICRIITDYEAGRSEWDSIFAVWAIRWGERPFGAAPDCQRP
jgi:hypothetical protein